MNIVNKIDFSKKDSKKKRIIAKNNTKLLNSKKIVEKISKNKNNNNSQEHNLINSYNYIYNGKDSIKNTNNEKRINSKSKNINSISTIGKENKKYDLNSSLSSLSFTSNRFMYGNNNKILLEQNLMYSTIRQKFNNYNRTFFPINDNPLNNISNNKNNINNIVVNDFDMGPKIEIKEEHNFFKRNKTNNELQINTMHKKQKSCAGLKIIDSKTQLRNKNSGERQKIKNFYESYKKIAINNNTMTRKKTNNIVTSNNNTNSNNTFIYDRNFLYNISFANTKRFSHKKNELLSSFQKDDNNKNSKNNFTSKKKIM
jgi:hypothetical protein